MTDATSTHPGSTHPARDRRKATEAIFAREQRHSRTVRVLKIALPAVALLLVAGIVGKSALSLMTGVSLDLAGTTIEGGRLVMANPSVEGMNAQNRKYEMKAARAIQAVSEPDVVGLEEIVARLPIGVSEWADVNAATGTMYREANRLDINSPVSVVTTDGLTARLLSATLDMSAGDISSNQPVVIDFDGSRVTADSINVTEGGSVMVFERNVRVMMQPSQISTAAATNGGGNARN